MDDLKDMIEVQISKAAGTSCVQPCASLLRAALLMACMILCRLPNVTPDDLDELADMMEVEVSEAADWQDADLRRLVRSCSELLAERLGKLQQLLKER